jgi:CheY-like chemotaxis protein
MPKKRALIVDHHRDKRLQLAAALKGPDLSIVMLESEIELFADAQPTDLFVLRAEMDRSSGYSMCNRLRSNERTARAKIVIVAADVKDPRLAQHKISAQPADAYIAPPLGLRDLRLQAYSLLDLDGGTVADDDIQAVEDDPFSAIDKALSENGGSARAEGDRSAEVAPADKPKPDFSDDDLEGAFGALDPTSKPKPQEVHDVVEADDVIEEAEVLEVKPQVQSAPSPLSQLSDEEMAFVADAFQRVKNTPNAPPLPPGIKSAKDLRGPEAKIFMLREKLREREMELARLQQIWQQHENEYKTSAQRVAEMEIEVKAAQMNADEATKKLKTRDEEIKRELKGSSVAIDKLLEDKFVLEKDLIEVVASKEKTLAELRRTVAARERDIDVLQKEKAALQQELVTTRANDDAALQQARMEGDVAVNEARAQGDAALQQARDQHAAALVELRREADEALSAAHQRAAEESERLQREMATRLEAAAQKLADTDLSYKEQLKLLGEAKAQAEQEFEETRSALEKKLAEYEDRMAQQDTQLAALRDDVARKEKNEMEQATFIGELKMRLESTEALAKERVEAARREREEVEARLVANDAAATERLAERTAELDAVKKEREEVQTRLAARIQEKETIISQKDAVFEQLSKEVQLAREEKDALTKRLSDRLIDREKTIDQLSERAEALQIEKIQIEERLKAMLDERARLERLMNENNDPAEATETTKITPAPPDPAQATTEPLAASPPAGHEDAPHDQEESIPIADSDESALLGSSKKVG